MSSGIDISWDFENILVQYMFFWKKIVSSIFIHKTSSVLVKVPTLTICDLHEQIFWFWWLVILNRQTEYTLTSHSQYNSDACRSRAAVFADNLQCFHQQSACCISAAKSGTSQPQLMQVMLATVQSHRRQLETTYTSLAGFKLAWELWLHW